MDAAVVALAAARRADVLTSDVSELTHLKRFVEGCGRILRI